MKKTEYIFTCEICGDTGKTGSGKPPANWVEISVENRYVDRDFTDKHVCDECCLTIKKRHEAA
jgi:ribosomal protein L37AE/L43A